MQKKFKRSYPISKRMPFRMQNPIVLSTDLYGALWKKEASKDLKLSVHLTNYGLTVIKFAVWEVYKNRAALATHMESKAFADLAAGIKGGLLDRPPIVECMC